MEVADNNASGPKFRAALSVRADALQHDLGAFEVHRGYHEQGFLGPWQG
jgi:hypothetical protein